jgi:hypothetical protein
MEAVILYLAKAGGLLAVFYLAYHFLLRKETFFRSNRTFLLAGLFTAALLPLIVYTKTVWVEPVVQPTIRAIDLPRLTQLVMEQKATSAKEEPIEINWFDVAAGMYFAGVLLFIIRFIIDIRSLRKVVKGNIAVKDGRYRLMDTNRITSPFSFFNYIIYNSAIVTHEELNAILVHEKVHSRQMHSLDMIISQLFCALVWFNPFMWMYKKAIAQNLEFIADAGAMKELADKTVYQKTLLKITIQPDCIAITNHFYQSLIKKRIVMLNKKQSKRSSSFKYALIVPALAAFILLFQVRVVAQEKQSAKTNEYTTTKIAVEVNKDSKDDQLAAEVKVLKEIFDTEVAFSNVTRNAKSEITGIKVAVKDKTQTKVYEVAGTEPIQPFTIEVEKNDGAATNSITFGQPNRNRNITEAVNLYTPDEEDGDAAPNVQKAVTAYAIAVPSPPSPPSPPSMVAPVSPVAPVSTGNINLNLGGTDALIIINGIKQPKGSVVMLQPGEQINTLNMVDKKEAKKKYGKDAKKGAIEITTRKNDIQGAFAFAMPEIDMDQVMNFAKMGMDIGFDAMANVDIQTQLDLAFDGLKDMDFNMLSAEERANLQEDLKQAQIEIQNLGPQLKMEMSKRKMSTDDAKREIEAARKEIEAAKKEIQKAQMEIQKAQKAQQAKKAATRKA